MEHDMRVPAFPIVASLVLLAAPAFAQSSTTTGAASEPSSAPGYSNSWHHGTSVSTDTKEKLRQSLENSGFKNVTVTPEAFVIRAQAPDGSRVVMLLRPDEMTGVIEQTGSSTAPGTSSNYGSSNTESGANH
jgi:hypothetical protein